MQSSRRADFIFGLQAMLEGDVGDRNKINVNRPTNGHVFYMCPKPRNRKNLFSVNILVNQRLDSQLVRMRRLNVGQI